MLEIFVAIASLPIHLSDIIATSTPASPVSVEVKSSLANDRVVAHGWLAEESIDPGFLVFASRYDSFEAYKVKATAASGFRFFLNLGDISSLTAANTGLHLPTRSFGTISFEEPTPVSMHRGERARQERCGFNFQPEFMDYSSASTTLGPLQWPWQSST